MEGKKISFGFMKTKKVDKIPVEENKEFIECVEEKSIKVVGGEIVQNSTPLVIPMKPNTLLTAERLQEIAAKVESALDEPEPINNDNSVEQRPENETIEQMALRELIEDSKKIINVETKNLTVALHAKPIIDGQKESSLEDYESVPVQEFGLAMLRGMGWTPNKDQSKYKQPQLRPKGLGLGADKVITENQKKNNSKSAKNDEDLTIMKNAFVKITTGKFSGYYGKIVSLDEDNGRVIVDIPIKKETVSLSEFMMYPVTKSEYDKESKVINADSFQEYKEVEKLTQKSIKSYDKGGSSKATENCKNKRENQNNDQYDERIDGDNKKSSNGRSRERSRKYSSSSDDRPRQKRKHQKKKFSSSDSLDSLSDNDKKYKKKEKKHRSSSSEPNSHKKRDKKKDSKRDIDKKRKGKKKRRDRDRSPNYKKHKK